MGEVKSIAVWLDRRLPVAERLTEEDAACQRGISRWKYLNKRLMDERDSLARVDPPNIRPTSRIFASE